MEKAVAGLAGGIVAANSSGEFDLECVVLCERKEPTIDIIRPEGYRVRCFDNSTTEHKRFGLAPDLRRFVLNDLRDGIVVLHGIFHPSVFLMSRLLRRIGMPYIIAPHDPYHPAMFASGRMMKSMYWTMIEKPMLRAAAGVQVLDRRHEKYLRDRGVTTPVIEVGNGFSPDDVCEAATLTWRTEGPIRILFLGRIDPVNKGLDLLIDAFASIVKTHPDARLTLQGPDRGDGPAARAQIERLGLSDRIEILPPEYKVRPSELASKYDFFVLPSRFEGFGLSALEAMLAARPILISDIAGLSPHVRKSESGVVVDSNVESIRSGMGMLIARRSEWRAMGEGGRDYVLRHLQWSHIAADTIPHYRRLAKPADGAQSASASAPSSNPA